MRAETIKGHLDLLLLAIVADGPTHGYAVINELARRSGGALLLAEGTVYPALHRLETAGVLASLWVSINGRRRRVYKLTPEGRKALARHRADWQAFTSVVGAVLAGRAATNPARLLDRMLPTMNPYLQYMAEEVAENHRDGLLSRREAMKRLAHLGLTAMSASAVLAACGSDDNNDDALAPASTTAAPAQTAAPGQTVAPPTTALSTVPAALPTQDITYAGKGRQVKGVFAAAPSPRGAVLVIHENQGVSAFQKSIVGRLAASGYTAIGVDLLSPQGGTAAVPTADISRVLTENATAGTPVDDMKSTLEELQRRAPNQKLGVTGFCFGGNMTWDLVAAGDPPTLSAAVPFYGSPVNPIFSKSKAAVLAMYAETDTRVNASQQQARLGAETARLTFDSKTWPGVAHAFMRMIDDPASGNGFTQATAAFLSMVAWFGQHLR